MNTTEIDAFILRIKGSIGSDKKNKAGQRVSATYKAKKSWKEAFALERQGKEHVLKMIEEVQEKLMKMLEITKAVAQKHNRLWTEVKEELELSDETKAQYNDATGEIEIVDKFECEVDEDEE